jgi:hypothetical protein
MIVAGPGATINFSPVQNVSNARDQIFAPSANVQLPPQLDQGVPPNAWVPPLRDLEMLDERIRQNPIPDSTSVSSNVSDFDSQPSLKKPLVPESEYGVREA